MARSRGDGQGEREEGGRREGRGKMRGRGQEEEGGWGRELRNKDTGIDITIPSHKEIKGLLHSTYEYQVVVVSILPYFKSPKHKESDVVQFAVSRKFQDFEDLLNKLSEKYPATVFPPLPKKVLIVNESSAKARRSKLEDFLKFLAGMPKLSASAILLEFLGVNAIKAGKYRKEDAAELASPTSNKTDEDPEPEPQTESLFEDQGFEDDDNEDDMFKDEDDDDNQNDMFDGGPVNQDTKLFDDQDLGGALEGDIDDGILGIPGATVEVKKTTKIVVETEDNSDLFISDEDLKKFEVQDDIKEEENVKEEYVTETKQMKQEDSIPVSALMESIDINEKEQKETQEETGIKKPVLKEKPKLPDRPKPAPRSKPSIPQKPSNSGDVDNSSSEMKKVPVKPSVKPKPKNITKDAAESREKPEMKPRPKPSIPSKPAMQSTSVIKDETKSKTSELNVISQKENSKGNVDSLNTDDILQYIQSANSNEDEVDLFS
ncbi:hypothetical protein FSP39_017146 [Pinctada imbricata]|uniref:PX domain-containing protein n=1 Tax=Pinctada imbricata TaxID=66713 RepID=A0AA89BZD2_PINIB|nr:hypothetical protein FSP39_017146 [Pinctada imbricata]